MKTILAPLVSVSKWAHQININSCVRSCRKDGRLQISIQIAPSLVFVPVCVRADPASDKTCLPIERFNNVPNQPSSQQRFSEPREAHSFKWKWKKSRGDREIYDEDERFTAGNNGKEQQQNKWWNQARAMIKMSIWLRWSRCAPTELDDTRC